MSKNRPKNTTTAELVNSLIARKFLFSPDQNREKIRIVSLLKRTRLLSPSLIIKYHDILCFMQAYPGNKRLLELVDEELATFNRRVEYFREIYGPDDDRIDDAGIVDTFIRYPYGILMARWLVENFDHDVDIDWLDYAEKEDDHLSGLLSVAALHMENDGVDNENLATEDWIDLALGANQTSLSWLLDRLDSLDIPESVRQHLYESAEPGLIWNLGKSAACRTLARKNPPGIYYQRSSMKKARFDLRNAPRKARPPLKLLSSKAGAGIIHRLIGALLPRHRELYPASYANPSEVYETSPGRGLKIYIIGMRPDDRMPLETNYSGLLIKNGVPVGYAISVLFFERCEIAINVFDTFRSGEASLIFDHFFRVFYHHFGARAFLMRRWQVGHENEEGLQSGSFWFYYKLGFRSIDPPTANLAESESGKIRRDRSYRSDMKTLKKLALSDLLVDLRAMPREPYREMQVSDIGIALTKMIAAKYGKDRENAPGSLERIARKNLNRPNLARWNRTERLQFKRWAPLLGLISDLESWKAAEKKDLLNIIRAKAAVREKGYVLSLQKHDRIKMALDEISRFGAD
jgi:hypothetical protein